MSAPTKQRTTRRPAKAKRKSRVTQYVDQQLERTRRQVKSVDLISAILLLVVMVIGFLLLAAIVDAWVFTLTPLMRWAALLLLVTGCVVMMVFSIWPLMTKKINPDYAAKMLEDAKPGFRNSLLNYVWFRKKPEAVGGAVFDAVARQAAVDLHSVPDDSSVDRSKVIRLGFWLVGMTAAMIAYFMLSPKNPLQTINRVLFPSANLSKPAVVTISDVTPGSTSVFFGDQVEITAKVYGPHSPEQVQLVYSTNDGRQSGQVRVMQPDPTTPRQYKLNLTENTGGLRESLEYEIVARDGQSGKFQLNVAPRPAITIESILIVPPKYTKLKSQTALQGAIDGVEGARVTVNAAANLPIDSATVELLNQLPTLPSEDLKFKPARSPKKMTVDGKNAKATFQLLLDTNREKPIATHYRLNFRSIDGESPAVPNIYPIRIIPDLAPELEVRTPVAAESKVPANGTLNVAAVANDVDYEISFVKIHVEHRGNQVLSKKLPLKTQPDNQRQALTQYVIRPGELGLDVGDQAIFYITAGDNRTTYFSDTEPAPNLTRSKNYSFTVVEPNSSEDGKRNKNSKSSDEENQSGDENQDPNKDQSGSSKEGDASTEGTGGSQEKDDANDGEHSEHPQEDGQPEGNDPQGTQDPNETADSPQTEQQDSEGTQSDDQNPSESEDGGTGESDASDGSDSKDSDPDGGGTGQLDQPQDEPSTDGSGGSDTDNDGGDPRNKSQGTGTSQQQPSDSGADASEAKKGNNPNKDNSVSDSAPERKDDNLTEGDEQPSSDLSEAERVRQLEKFFSDNPDKQNQERESNAPEGQQQTDDSQDPSKDDQRNPSENSKQNPNDTSAEPGNQDQPSKDQGNKPSGNPGQKDAGDDPQNGNPPNDSPENKPSGKAPQQDSINPQENNPSKSPNSSADPASESDNPGQGDETGEQSPDDGTGEKSPSESPPSESPSGKPGGEDQPKPEGSPSEQGQPGESASGQGPQSQQPGGEPKEGGPEGEASDSAGSGPAGKPGSGKPGQSSEKKEGSESTGIEGGNGTGDGDIGHNALQREKENLEYSKKAIDLLLDDLRSQRHNPDPELLKKMGWDKQDLNDYVDSWDEMREAAKQGNADAQRKLKRREKSLGLQPNDKRRAVAGNQEEAGTVIQDGAVNEAPPEEFHSFNSFLQDLQRARD